MLWKGIISAFWDTEFWEKLLCLPFQSVYTDLEGKRCWEHLAFIKVLLLAPASTCPAQQLIPSELNSKRYPAGWHTQGTQHRLCPKNMQCVGGDGCHNVPLALGWTQAFQHIYLQLSDSLSPGIRWVDKASGLSLRAIVPPTQLLLPCQVKEGPVGRVISVCGTLLPRATADGKCTRI